jgi:hypothetical protein
MRGWRAAAVVVMALGWPAAAQTADPREDQAKTACLAGRVQEGIDLLAQLYVATADANYIYNQGRCLEQNGRPDEAIGRFQEYLRKGANLTPEDRADAERHIHECERLRDRLRAPRPPPPGPAVVEEGPAPRRIPKSTKVLVGVSAGLVVAGLAAGIGVQAVEDSVMHSFASSKEQWGKRLEVLQYGAYVAAGLCLVGGAALYFAPAPGGVAVGGTF